MDNNQRNGLDFQCGLLTFDSLTNMMHMNNVQIC